MARQVNAATIALADASEGCLLRAYKDPKGVVSIGFGHTGPDVKMGDTCTQEQADAWRQQDMAKAAAFVDAHVKVPLTDNQFGALVDFAYNCGTGAFLGSTLLKKLNQRNYAAVPVELMNWVNITKNGKKVPEPGLVARRKLEVALWGRSENIPAQTILASNESICTPTVKPEPPTLIERIKAWFHRNAQVPT